MRYVIVCNNKNNLKIIKDTGKQQGFTGKWSMKLKHTCHNGNKAE